MSELPTTEPMDEMEAVSEETIEERNLPVSPPERVTPPQKRPSRRGLIITVVVFLLAVAGGIGFLVGVQNKEKTQWQQAQSAARDGAWSLAEQNLDAQLAIQPSFVLVYVAEAHGLRGIVRYQQGDRVGAMADLDEALALDADLVDVYAYRALAGSDEREARADAQTAVDSGLLSPYLQAQMHMILAGSGETAAIAAALEQSDYLADEQVVELALAQVAQFEEAEAWAQVVEATTAVLGHDYALQPEQIAQLAYKTAIAHQETGNAEAAFIYAGKALAQAEELTAEQQVMLYMLQAVWYEGRGELETAVTAAEAAAALDDTITLHWALQAWQAYRAFDMETAVTAAETVLAATTADDLSTQIAQRTLGGVATLQDNPRPALAALDAALAINPNDIEARALRVHNLAVVSEWEAASKDTAFLAELAPTAPTSLWAQAIVARLDNDRALVQVLMNQAIAQDTTHPEYYWFRAISYRTTMDQDKEADDLAAALALYPEFLLALEAQQHLLLDRYNYEQLEEVAYQLIEIYPHSAAGYRLLTAYYLYVEGDNEAALQHAEEVVARNPDTPRGYELRGHVYLQLNDLEAARADYEQMLTLDPNSSGARFGLASIARREEDWETAVNLTQEIVELYPRSLSAKIDLASAYLDQNDLEKAWQLVHQVLAEDPRNVQAMLLRAYLYSFQGEHEQALSEVEKTLNLFPNNAFAHVTKASFLIDLGRPDEAAESAEEAIALDALLADPHRLLFFVALENEDFEEAEIQLDLWREKATYYDDNPELLSYMQLVTGRYEDAIDTTTAALVEASETDGLYYNRALAYLNLEQAEEGQADMEQVLSVSQNLDLIVDAEEVLVDSRQVVRVGDGRLQFSNETFGYTVNYADWWDKIPADEEQNIDLFLLYETDDDFGAAYAILFVEQDEVTAELIAGYVLEGSAQRSDFTLISAEPTPLNEGESYVIRYELQGSELFQGKQYIFTKGNRIVLLTMEAYDRSFVEMEAEIDAIAASFVFLP